MIHPNGNNAVDVSAKWNESEFDERIEPVQKTDNVKGI